MICEYQISNILLNRKNAYLPINRKITFFGSPLKKLLNTIHQNFEIPDINYAISLYYLYNYYHLNKDIQDKLTYFFSHLNIFFFTCLILSVKQIEDESLTNIKLLCNTCNINYNNYIEIEEMILHDLKWNTFINLDKINEFKKYLEHYMDLPRSMDSLS